MKKNRVHKKDEVVEKPKIKKVIRKNVLFFHQVGFNAQRGFTVAGVISNDQLTFGMAIKIPIGDNQYEKEEGRKGSYKRAQQTPYKVINLLGKKPRPFFYREITRLKPWFSKFETTTRKSPEYNGLIRFIKKHKATDANG